MIKDNDIVRITDLDYDGLFYVVSATSLSALPGDEFFSLVSIVEPMDPDSFNAFAKDKWGIADEWDDFVVDPKKLEVVNEQATARNKKP